MSGIGFVDEIRAKYRQVFLHSQLGKDVLADILKLCKFGCSLDPENLVQVSEYNVGVAILHRLGILAEDTLEDVVRALASIVPLEKTKEDKK